MFKLKMIAVSLVCLLQTHAFSQTLSGKNFSAAADAALLESSFELGDTIYAWETLLSGDEIITNVLSVNDDRLGLGCHLHDEEMVCHQESKTKGTDKYFKGPAATLEYAKKGNSEALKKFEKAMKQRKKDLDVMSSYKAWVNTKGTGSSHNSGTDVWTKIDYDLGQGPQVIFIVCHVHGASPKFFCHYRNAGQNEPVLDFPHDDDHGDDDHGHDDDNDDDHGHDDDDHSGHDH